MRAYGLAALLICVATDPAQATSVLNLGVDITTSGAQSTMSFFEGDDSGFRLAGGRFSFGVQITEGGTLEILVDTQSLLDGYSVLRGELFIDATDIGPSDLGVVFGGSESLGVLANTRARDTSVPVESGFGGRGLGVSNDVDNTFLLLSSGVLSAMQGSSTYLLSITNATTVFHGLAGGFRINGINLQFEVEPLSGTPPTPTATPEPSTLAMGGLTALVAGGAAWRRRRQAASA
jgi:MYXO-CTERM domain-containing protein